MHARLRRGGNWLKSTRKRESLEDNVRLSPRRVPCNAERAPSKGTSSLGDMLLPEVMAVEASTAATATTTRTTGTTSTTSRAATRMGDRNPVDYEDGITGGHGGRGETLRHCEKG